MGSIEDFFNHPKDLQHRIYEALRAFHVDELPGPEVAKKFGFTYASFRNLCYNYRQDPEQVLFPNYVPEQILFEDSLQDRIIDLRTTHQASIYTIRDTLEIEGRTASPSYISRVIRNAGLPKLTRRKRKSVLPATPNEQELP